MPPLRTFDCIVIGGGPAGSMTAYTLAKCGINVAILEGKSTSKPSRPKVCGGGLQLKAVRMLPFGVKEVVEREIYGMVFQRRLKSRFTRRYSLPISYTVNRARFDNLLLRYAQESGATLLLGERALSLEHAPNHVKQTKVFTERGVFGARVVVGADGAGSIVRRAINPGGIAQVQLGVICELEKDSSTKHIPGDLFIIDWGTVPGGYAWIFPKEATLTVGAMVPRELVRTLRAYLRAFLEKEGLKIRDERIRVHPIPTRRLGEPIASAWGVLVGDAAGLTDPFTGEGLYYALMSGQVAAHHVKKYLVRGNGSLLDYEKEIDTNLMQEIIVAGKMRSFFNTFSSYIHNLYRKNDRLWYAFCEVMRGDRTLEGLRRVRTRPPRPILRYLERFTSWYEARQISRFKDSATYKSTPLEERASRY
ncbi:MAG: geranylgeranyl reductase family protein [Candidatus Brocadiales bacterium]